MSKQCSIGQTVKETLPKAGGILFLFVLAFIFSMQCGVNIWNNGEAGIDSSVFRTVAMLMTKGYMPYMDTFDHKGPLLYIINYLGMLLSYYRGIWILELLTIFITFYFMYKTARLFCRPLIAGISVMIASTALYSYFDGGNLVEEYALPFIAFSLYCYTRYFLKDEVKKWEIFVCGACFAAVLLLRPNMAVIWCVFSLAVFIHCIVNRAYKVLKKYLILFLAGMSCAVLPVILWIWVNGALYDFVNDYIFFNLKYTGTGTLIDRWNACLYFLKDTVALWALAIVLYAIVKEADYLPICYGCSILLSVYAISVSGLAYDHYGMILIPVYIYPIGFLLGQCDKAMQKERIASVFVILYLSVSLMLPVWLDGISHMIENYDTRDQEKRSEAVTSIVNYIVSNTEEDDKITVYGNWDIIYVLSQRLPASRYSYQSPIGQIDPTRMEEYLAEITSAQPELIVLRQEDEEILSFIANNNYRQVYGTATDPSIRIFGKEG